MMFSLTDGVEEPVGIPARTGLGPIDIDDEMILWHSSTVCVADENYAG